MPDQSPNPHPDLEQRLTALLLGELSEPEAAEVRKAMAADPTLQQLHDQLAETIGLVREISGSMELAEASTNAGANPPKLSDDRRAALIAAFKVVQPDEFAQRERRRTQRRELLLVAAMLMGLLAVAGLFTFTRTFPSMAAASAVALRGSLGRMDGDSEDFVALNDSEFVTPTTRDLSRWSERGAEVAKAELAAPVGGLGGAAGSGPLSGGQGQLFIKEQGRTEVESLNGAAKSEPTALHFGAVLAPGQPVAMSAPVVPSPAPVSGPVAAVPTPASPPASAPAPRHRVQLAMPGRTDESLAEHKYAAVSPAGGAVLWDTGGAVNRSGAAFDGNGRTPGLAIDGREGKLAAAKPESASARALGDNPAPVESPRAQDPLAAPAANLDEIRVNRAVDVSRPVGQVVESLQKQLKQPDAGTTAWNFTTAKPAMPAAAVPQLPMEPAPGPGVPAPEPLALVESANTTRGPVAGERIVTEASDFERQQPRPELQELSQKADAKAPAGAPQTAAAPTRGIESDRFGYAAESEKTGLNRLGGNAQDLQSRWYRFDAADKFMDAPNGSAAVDFGRQAGFGGGGRGGGGGGFGGRGNQEKAAPTSDSGRQERRESEYVGVTVAGASGGRSGVARQAGKDAAGGDTRGFASGMRNTVDPDRKGLEIAGANAGGDKVNSAGVGVTGVDAWTVAPNAGVYSVEAKGYVNNSFNERLKSIVNQASGPSADQPVVSEGLALPVSRTEAVDGLAVAGETLRKRELDIKAQGLGEKARNRAADDSVPTTPAPAPAVELNYAFKAKASANADLSLQKSDEKPAAPVAKMEKSKLAVVAGKNVEDLVTQLATGVTMDDAAAAVQPQSAENRPQASVQFFADLNRNGEPATALGFDVTGDSAGMPARRLSLNTSVASTNSIRSGSREKLERLTERLRQSVVDDAIPRTSIVEVIDPAEPEVKTRKSFWGTIAGAFGNSRPSATARIAVQKDAGDIAGIAGAAAPADFDPYWVQTQQEEVQSKSVLNNVADNLNLKNTWAGQQGAASPLSDDEAYRRLRERVEVRHDKNGLLSIRVEGDTPQESARIANEIADVYKRQRAEKANAIQVAGIKVLEEKFDQERRKLAEAEMSARQLSEEAPAPRQPAPNAPVPQPEVVTADNPFSTFSLNVSDVSFKLAAASLEKGQMPDVSTVRTEEFINALDYRDPEPTGGQRLAFHWERARYPFAHNRDLVRFSVKTAATGRQPGRPLNLVLLLDNSGSMERSDRLRIRRECLRVLAGQLQPQDTVSVVAFARTARLWVDGLSGAQAGELPQRVGSLSPDGGTNLEEAMNLAYQTARRHFQTNGINRVVLLTDGAANLGEVDPAALKARVESNRRSGVALDCFGIGWDGYNDDLLETLSRNGDGRYGFINSTDAAATEFAGQLAGALRVAASDVKVQVQFNPARVTAYRQMGYAKHQLKKEEFRDNTVDAAEIGAAEAGNALYVVEVNPRGEGPLGVARVRFRIPGTQEYQEQEWTLSYDGPAKAFEQGPPALRLAGVAAAFSEWLIASPFAAEVTPNRLLRYLGMAPSGGSDPRPKQLESMLRQASSLK